MTVPVESGKSSWSEIVSSGTLAPTAPVIVMAPEWEISDKLWSGVPIVHVSGRHPSIVVLKRTS
jgi:hypothetical protein